MIAVTCAFILTIVITYRVRFTAWIAALALPIHSVCLIFSLISLFLSINNLFTRIIYGVASLFLIWQLIRCARRLEHEQQKYLSIHRKASLWKSAEIAGDRRSIAEVTKQIIGAVKSEGHTDVSAFEVEIALVHEHYPGAD